MKQHFKISLLLILSMAFLSQHINAQDYDKSLLNQITPVEPTTSSLGKYGVYPVNRSTGLVPITIPIYEIKSGGLTQMIELSYHGGGVKVADEATWVGLGWDLNYGGIITRNVNGFPDALEPYYSMPDAVTMTNALKDNSDFSLVDGYYRPLSEANVCDRSFKPDLYSYNFGNYSGTFLVKDSKPMFVAHNAIDGIVSENGILLTTPNGEDYDFDGYEQTTLHSISTLNRFFTYCSGYHISSILSQNKTDSIIYTYQDDGVFNSNLNSFNQGIKKTTISGCLYHNSIEHIPVTETTMFTQTVTSKKPQYIYFNEGRITFNLNSRSDLDPEICSIQKLDNILIEKKVGSTYQEVKRIVFMYSYFNGTRDSNYKRLCLDSIVEWLPDATHLLASFSYNEDFTLPNKKAFSIDHWGYFNGKGGDSPIPLTYYEGIPYGSADRSPDVDYAKIATIKSITYPTRGKTNFEWELNRVNSEEPIYMKPEFQDINIHTDYNSTLDCQTIGPEDGDVGMVFHSYINQTLTVEYYLYKEDPNNLTHNKYDTGEIGINGNIICPLYNPTSIIKEATIYLLAGTDNYVYIKTNCKNVKGYIHLKYNAYNPALEKNNYPFAGLRIKEINNFDIDGSLLNSKRYSYLNESGQSSGVRTNSRNMSYTKYSKYINGKLKFNGQMYCMELTDIKTFNVFSTMRSGMDANSFSYEYVQEESVFSNTNNGLSKYQFTVCNDETNQIGVPVISKNHLRGQLLRKTDYQRTGTNYKMIREEQNYYSKDSRVTATKVGFYLDCDLDFLNSSGVITYNTSGGEDLEYPGTFFFPYNYIYTSDWLHLDSTITKEYFQSTTPVITRTINQYGNEKHLQPTTVTTESSSGKTLCTHTKYSLDVQSSIADEMSSRNILTQPIDIKSFIKISNIDSTLTGGYSLNYALDSYNHLNLWKVSKYLPDGTLDLLNSYTYNARGRLIEATGSDNLTTSIYWGNDGYHPLVIGKNISYSNLLTAIQSTTDLSQLFSKPVCANALITTYTYNPLLGISSKTDPRGLKTFFNYDNLGRCTSICDFEYNILNLFQYHYIGQ